jgi:hypothetical protein
MTRKHLATLRALLRRCVAYMVASHLSLAWAC